MRLVHLVLRKTLVYGFVEQGLEAKRFRRHTKSSMYLIRFNQIVPIELVFCLAAFLWYIFDVSVC